MKATITINTVTIAIATIGLIRILNNGNSSTTSIIDLTVGTLVILIAVIINIGLKYMNRESIPNMYVEEITEIKTEVNIEEITEEGFNEVLNSFKSEDYKYTTKEVKSFKVDYIMYVLIDIEGEKKYFKSSIKSYRELISYLIP